MVSFVPVNEPLLNGNEKKYLCECIDTGWISSEGPFVKRFEEDMCKFVGRKFATAVCNGTAALELAVTALELPIGSEVIVPTFTIVSCVQAITNRGLKPVLVDSDPITWNMNIEQVEAKINSNTSAIMVVHIYGLPVDMNPMIQLAKRNNLKIIEDAAEMHGQTYDDKECGSFGDISTFSFYPNKHITSGEGGMVLTDDPRLHERCQLLRNLCFEPSRRYYHREIGYNFRMTNMQAAVGVAQLEKIEEFIVKKRSIGKLYTQLLEDIEELQLPLEKTDYSDNIYWVYGIILDDRLPMDNTVFMEKLAQNRIGTRSFFWPMHEQPVFRNMGLFQNESYPVAERIARRGLYLPSGLKITEEQIFFVAERVKKIVKEYR